MRRIENDDTRAGKCKVYEIIPKKVILFANTKRPIKYLFSCNDGFMLRNLRFNIKWCRFNPKGMRLHIQLWNPFIYLVRDNIKWEIGNKYRLVVYH